MQHNTALSRVPELIYSAAQLCNHIAGAHRPPVLLKGQAGCVPAHETQQRSVGQRDARRRSWPAGMASWFSILRGSAPSGEAPGPGGNHQGGQHPAASLGRMQVLPADPSILHGPGCEGGDAARQHVALRRRREQRGLEERPQKDSSSFSPGLAPHLTCPPARRNEPCSSQASVCLPSLMQSSGPFRTSTGPPSRSQTSRRAAGPLGSTPRAEANRPNSTTLGVSTALA